MPKSEAFVLQYSDLNDFLFADVGIEPSGMTLTVLSLLARVGLDPWREAGRLAQLPRSKAIDGLARIIAAMPTSQWSVTDASPMATKLVALLPTRSGHATGAPSRLTETTPAIGAWLRAKLPLGAGPSGRHGRPARSIVLWAIAVAVAGGLLMGASFGPGAPSGPNPAPLQPSAQSVPTTD